MRELTSDELVLVSGGGVVSEALDSARTGGELGSIVGFILTETGGGAARGGLAGAAVGFSFSVGYSIGTWIYNHWCG